MRGFARTTQQKWIRWLVFLLFLISTQLTLWHGKVVSAQGNESGSFTYLPMTVDSYCIGTHDASNPIGLQLYGTTGYTRPDFRLLQDTQSSWARNHIDWYVMEPQNVAPSKYRWAVADNSLRAAIDNCINLIVTIDGTPRWAATSHIHSPFRPEMRPEFVELVRAIVERYDGDGIDDAPGSPVVNYWEFYNEPDVGSTAAGDGWGVFPEEYAAMLKAVYPVVKDANPNAQVVFGGISYDSFVENGGIFVRDFFEKVLAAGGGDSFDFMNIHFYPFHDHRQTWTQSKSSGLNEKIADVRAHLATYDLKKELMITEIGWHSSGSTRSPSNDEYQSRYVVQLLTQAKAAGATSITWWAFLDARGYPFKSGLVTDAYVIKPVYPIYLEAVQRIGTALDLRLLVEPTETNDLEVYSSREAKTDKVQYIAWLNPIAPFNAEAVATFDDQIVENWQAPGARADVFAKNGILKSQVRDEDDGDRDGMLTFSVGTDPIYIVIE